MSKIKFTGHWTARWQLENSIPKGFLLIKYEPKFRKSLGSVLNKLDQFQIKKLQQLVESGKIYEDKDYLRELEIDLNFYYQKRTLDQNALMWALYEIEANEMNGGESGHKNQVVTKDELYNGDLYEWGEREIIFTRRKNLELYAEEYRIIEKIITKDKKEYDIHSIKKVEIDQDEKIRIVVIRSTSKINTIDMMQWINRIFNRLAYNGVQVTNPGEIQDYWFKFRSHLNDKQIILHDNVMTQEEYKALNPICEGCGEMIVNKGHLAHIQAFGMGGDRTKEPKKNYASNWLHLCVECHICIQHQKGWKEFLKQFHHLTYKVNTALSRDYKPIDGISEKIDTIKQIDLKQEIERIVVQYNSGNLTMDESCLELDKLGADPGIINKNWIGIY